jgi:hypothetical protein
VKSLKNRVTWSLATATAVMTAAVAVASPAAAAVPSTTAVQASPSSATTGQAVTLTATVTCAGDPSGGLGMTFFDGGDLLNTVPVSSGGVATYSAQFATVGTHTITAAYNGNDNCNASNGTTTVAISQTPTTPSGGFCLLSCGGLIVFNTGDIHNEINFGSTTPGWSAHGARG